MNSSIRFATEADADALVSFWNENADWDVIDRAAWEHRFYHTPYGPAYIVIATAKEIDTIEGQFIFFPSEVNVQGSQLKACRPFAPIVKRQIREELGMLTLMEYIFNMYQFATAELAKRDIALVHMLPDPRWSRAFQMLPGVQIGYFPLWSIGCERYHPQPLGDQYSVETIDASDPRLDRLWEKAKHLYEGSIVRNAHMLPWKLSHGTYRLIGISEGDELIGISASVYKIKDKQWLICETLSVSEQALRVVLTAACNEAIDYYQTLDPVNKEDLRKIAILATPLIQQVAEGIGFVKDNYQFPMVLHVLSESWQQKGLQPERWYASAND